MQNQQPAAGQQGQQIPMEDVHDIYGRDCLTYQLIIKQQQREIAKLRQELESKVDVTK